MQYVIERVTAQCGNGLSIGDLRYTIYERREYSVSLTVCVEHGLSPERVNLMSMAESFERTALEYGWPSRVGADKSESSFLRLLFRVVEIPGEFL